MTDEEYMIEQKRILLVAMLAKPIDVAGFISRIGEAETLTPILDPTLYRRGVVNLIALKRLAEAVRSVQRAAEDLSTAVLETGIKEMQMKEHF